MLLGPGKVIGVEYAGMRCRIVDVPESTGRWRALVCILREFDPGIAQLPWWRPGGEQVGAVFEPLRLPAANSATGFGEGGVPGTELEIGSTLARYLAGAFRAKLALLSRFPLPAAGEADSIPVNGGRHDAAPERTRLVRELESAGAEVLVLQGDVADADYVVLWPRQSGGGSAPSTA